MGSPVDPDEYNQNADSSLNTSTTFFSTHKAISDLKFLYCLTSLFLLITNIFSISLPISGEWVTKFSISSEMKIVLALQSFKIEFIISFDNNVLIGTGITPALRHPQKITGNSIWSNTNINTLSSLRILYFVSRSIILLVSIDNSLYEILRPLGMASTKAFLSSIFEFKCLSIK